TDAVVIDALGQVGDACAAPGGGVSALGVARALARVRCGGLRGGCLRRRCLAGERRGAEGSGDEDRGGAREDEAGADGSELHGGALLCVAQWVVTRFGRPPHRPGTPTSREPHGLWPLPHGSVTGPP